VDLAMIEVWVPDAQTLRTVLGVAQVSLECGAPRRDGDQFVVVLYGSAAEAQKIAKLGYKHQIDEHYGDVLAQRQGEVSRTDRFRGGTIKPAGLGVKRKG
jgi:hypothetical protein